MTNPTLERAARALAACEQSDYEFGEMADHYIAMARAVLMSVRDCDEYEITTAGRIHADGGWNFKAAMCFTAMIDAILNEDQVDG